MIVVHWLLDADRWLFHLINSTLSYQPIDGLMLLLRQAFTWIPLYLFFLLFFIANCRKYIVPIIMLSVLTFAIADFTSASILKPAIGRIRPCHDVTLTTTVRNIAGCGGIFSMPSSHAANHFALSMFWFLMVSQLLRLRWYWLFGWAFIVGLAQVYVGVHYPADILLGALLGCCIGWFTWSLFKRWMSVKPEQIHAS